MHARAQLLPKNGVPPEVIRCLNLDDNLDKLHVQKAATPVEGRHEAWNEAAAHALQMQRPNAVVMERSSFPEADTNKSRAAAFAYIAQNSGRPTPSALASRSPRREDTRQRTASKARSRSPRAPGTHTRTSAATAVLSRSHATQHILVLASTFLALGDVARMSVSSCSQYHTIVDWPTASTNLAAHIEALTTTWRTYVVATGNQMMNQFVPWYFGVAFAFCFKYCIGMPDMPD